jgi:predicted MPP superfamily phosphohydrolase
MPFDLTALLLALFWLAVAALVWATQIERRWYRIRRETLAILPPGSEPIRILHIGDIHLAPWQKGRARFVHSLAEKIKPDLVVNTGDNVGHANGIKPVLAALKPLDGVAGVFVNGSNDYHAPTPRNPFTYLAHPSDVGAGAPLNTQELVAGLESYSWLNLNNRAGQLVVNSTRIGFLGVDDAHEDLADLASLDSSEAKAATTGADIVIGVSHAPYLRVIDSMADHGVDLLLAGHTHGGQVCLPFFGALVTNCDLPTKNAKGLSAFQIADKKILLKVVAGIGHSIFAPIRFACFPEVRVLTLTA